MNDSLSATTDEAVAAPRPSRDGTSRRRVVIAEDQPDLARWLADSVARLRPDWEICATVSRVDALLEAVDESVPDLLILDVHLGDGSCMDVVQQLPYPMPIVFTSGDPQLAIDAFEHAAVDYVLKPVRMPRLAKALARVDAVETRTVAGADPGAPAWITARKGQATVIVRLSDVLYMQSQAKYTRVVLRDGEALLKRGLGMVEQQLDPARFRRIHRSTVINIDHAATLVRDDLGRMKLQMHGRPDWLFISKPFEGIFKSH
jgi:DNA-binding LytR/AlgR family response regulator